jgi:hypothetical protein
VVRLADSVCRPVRGVVTVKVGPFGAGTGLVLLFFDSTPAVVPRDAGPAAVPLSGGPSVVGVAGWNITSGSWLSAVPSGVVGVRHAVGS